MNTAEQRKLELRRRQIKARLEAAEPSQEEPKSFWQSVWENVVGDDDDTTQNFGEKVGTSINKAGESMTFGFVGDEASAAAAGMIPGGRNYDERLAFERDQERQLEQSNPGAAMTAEIGGAFLPALSGVGAIGTLGRGAALMPRIAASTAAGAAGAGTYGFMEGEGAENRVDQMKSGAMLGASVGALAPALGAGVQRLADSRAAKKAIKKAAKNAPSTADLRAQAQAAYGAVDDAGVQIKPDVFSSRMRDATARLSNQGLDDLPGPGSLTPKSARAVQIGDEMGSAMAGQPGAGLPFSSLDKLRRHASTAAGSMDNATDSSVGTRLVGEIDDMVKNLSPDDLVAGDANALKTALPKARDLWARMSRSQTIDNAMEQSENYLSNQASGIRNQFARILRSDKLSRGFSKAEKDMMRRVVQGTASKRILDLLGGGMGSLVTMGTGAGIGSTGGPVGSAIGALIGAGAASGATKASERITRSQAEALRAIIANGGLERLPVATDAARRTVESLMRRGAAVGAQ